MANKSKKFTIFPSGFEGVLTDSQREFGYDSIRIPNDKMSDEVCKVFGRRVCRKLGKGLILLDQERVAFNRSRFGTLMTTHKLIFGYRDKESTKIAGSCLLELQHVV